MKINSETLNALRKNFNTAFQKGLGSATALSSRIAMEIPSSSGEEVMGWINAMPNAREWVGDRHIKSFGESDYAIKNKKFELTIGVKADHIKDDKLGIYAPMFQQMGDSTGSHRETLLWATLKDGFTKNGFDKQFFFDTDHPVLDADGKPTVYANTDGGAGTPWFLVCSNKVLKPVVWTNREEWDFVAMDNPNDPTVFMKDEFIYGSKARYNAGFGFPQLAWGSKQTLDAAHYATARAGISGMKGDYARPLGLVPDLLIVPPSLESAARKLLNSENAAGGETNEWKGTAELLVCPWLA